MATTNYGFTELDLDHEPNIGQVNVPLQEIDATIKAEFDALEAEADAGWTAFTPGWQTGGTGLNIGNGTLGGRYKQVGRLMLGETRLERGSTTNLGSGNYQFGLPGFARAYDRISGVGFVRSATTGIDYGLFVRGVVSGWVALVYTSTDVRMASANRFTWAAGDVIYAQYWYEV